MEQKVEAVYNYLQKKDYPDHFTKYQRQNLRRLASRYTLEENTLYHYTKGVKQRVVTTVSEALELFREFHHSAVGGHSGIKKTRHAFTSRFYWPGMSKDIEDWISKCSKCQKVGKLLHVDTQLQRVKGPLWDVGPRRHLPVLPVLSLGLGVDTGLLQKRISSPETPLSPGPVTAIPPGTGEQSLEGHSTSEDTEVGCVAGRTDGSREMQFLSNMEQDGKINRVITDPESPPAYWYKRNPKTPPLNEPNQGQPNPGSYRISHRAHPVTEEQRSSTPQVSKIDILEGQQRQLQEIQAVRAELGQLRSVVDNRLKELTSSVLEVANILRQLIPTTAQHACPAQKGEPPCVGGFLDRGIPPEQQGWVRVSFPGTEETSAQANGERARITATLPVPEINRLTGSPSKKMKRET
ncbi:protein SPT10-like isoform X2 [Polyodon spathula]|uniref:protein SPT10-like isoform X2 n=1 Tax=Polyodon spathula TaxID=7913 RepID=UPI001B7E5C41|nr:protein SPT10-like isoform X2 [Polyodon spathula]